MLPSHFSACSVSAVSGVSSSPAVAGDRLEPSPPLRQRRLQQRFVAFGQQVEDDVAGRDLLREQFDARLRRVDPFLQGIEFEVAVGVADHQLAVEHPAPRREAQLGEVAAEVFAAARLDLEVLAVDEDDRPEAVELGLVGPLLADRQLFAGQRQLRLDRWREGKGHSAPRVRISRRRRRPGAGSGSRAGRGSAPRRAVSSCSRPWGARRPGRRSPARRSCRCA